MLRETVLFQTSFDFLCFRISWLRCLQLVWREEILYSCLKGMRLVELMMLIATVVGPWEADCRWRSFREDGNFFLVEQRQWTKELGELIAPQSIIIIHPKKEISTCLPSPSTYQVIKCTYGTKSASKSLNRLPASTLRFLDLLIYISRWSPRWHPLKT